MTKNDVLENLKALIDNEYDPDEIICAFGDFEENGETRVLISKNYSRESEYDAYYRAYVDSENSTEYGIYVEKIEENLSGSRFAIIEIIRDVCIL